MLNIHPFLHTLYTINIALLLAGILSFRYFWPRVNETLAKATGIKAPWMPIVFGLTFFFLLVGLFLLSRDIIAMVFSGTLVSSKWTDTGLVAALILSNAFIIPIIWRVSIMGYVPVASQISRVLMRAQTNYVLPELLRLSDGTEIIDSKMWVQRRRPEILALFEKNVYGTTPTDTLSTKASLRNVNTKALNGKAIRKETVLTFGNGKRRLELNVLMYLPKESDKPAPAFVALNFAGNHTIHSDPEITLSRRWSSDGRSFNRIDERTPPEPRGYRSSRWPIERIAGRGYAIITAHCEDIDPDSDDGFQDGIRSLFSSDGRERPGPQEWGAIAAWAWGLSRILDYLETDQDIDHSRIAALGHSRLGKAALWAGARDERFAIVISNDSGSMGAALSRREYGEKIADITSSFPYWFCNDFKSYAGRENELPVDQHMLISLIAPRPVYIASADLDTWADPKGEFLAAKAASKVYRLFGKDGLAADTQPKLNQPVMSTIGYHIRSGTHGVLSYDWDCFMNFADIHFGLIPRK